MFPARLTFWEQAVPHPTGVDLDELVCHTSNQLQISPPPSVRFRVFPDSLPLPSPSIVRTNRTVILREEACRCEYPRISLFKVFAELEVGQTYALARGVL
jgi:hypothetical protein